MEILRRDRSATFAAINELFLGERNPQLVTIPAGVLHGFKGIAVEPAYLINVSSEPYYYSEPGEFRVPPDDPCIPYDRALKNG